MVYRIHFHMLIIKTFGRFEKLPCRHDEDRKGVGGQSQCPVARKQNNDISFFQKGSQVIQFFLLATNSSRADIIVLWRCVVLFVKT